MIYFKAKQRAPSNSQRQSMLFRFSMSALTIILLPPFVTLAVAPMMLMLVPIALVAIPVMIQAFFGAAYANRQESQHLQAWRPALAALV
jgi:hypothetical protein